jgi:DNA mismatch endonuclease, patch repair protein
MADNVSRRRRSEIMSRIRSRNTAPEMEVRRFLHGRGLRYRIHREELPGKPDLVFPQSRTCVFVHGCFWHGCPRCTDGTRRVKSNSRYWSEKIEGNRERDQRHTRTLRSMGWKVLTIWECQIADARRMGQLAQTIESRVYGRRA